MTIFRPEAPGDEPGIRALHESAFPTDLEGRLVDALRAAGRLRVSRVAVSEDAIVGHIAFSPVEAAGALDGVGLAPLAVAPAWQRQGIGGHLIRDGLAECRRAGFGFVVVLGDPNYYGQFGFAPASRWGLSDEYGGGDAFQAIELRTAAIPTGAGLVRYDAAFAVFAE